MPAYESPNPTSNPMLISPLTPGFMVIHGNQPELLRQLLVRWFRAYPLAPLEDEIILVQSNGMAQWLKLALAAQVSPSADDEGGCGIAAAFDMQLPSRFMWQAYRAVLGADAVPEVSPFDKSALIWRLMRLLPEQVTQRGYEPLARFLTDDSDGRKRYQLAEKLADLFDQYQVYRADWLGAWAEGREELPCGGTSQHGRTDVAAPARPLPPSQRWQALLWRALLDDVGEGERQSSRAGVHQAFLRKISELDTAPAGLPRRMVVFGVSALPRQSLEVLEALSRFSQVMLCVHNPCRHYWADLRAARDDVRQQARHPRRSRHDRKPSLAARSASPLEDLSQYAHPLLASWGKQGRDYIALLDEIDRPEGYRPLFEALRERIDLFHSPVNSEKEGEGHVLLKRLQDDILELRSVSESREKWGGKVGSGGAENDSSLRFHIAHSPLREVEVLHDQLLAAMNADASLRPRDIIVMVPDVNAYAPYIQAVFGLIPSSDKRYIPFSITDLSLRRQAPLVRALEFLLSVPEARLNVSQVLDLLDVPALRQRFGLSAEDLPLLRRWIEQTHIRWGLDADHRQTLMGAGALTHEQNTWKHGMKRMLLGYAVGGDPGGADASEWLGIEPYAEVSGLEAALLGPLDALLDRLEHWVVTLGSPATPAEWGRRLPHILSDFFKVDTPEDEALWLQLEASLQAWVGACEAAGLNEPLPLAVVRDYWLGQMDSPHLRQRFMAGQVTFATLMPMRAVPFRRVCLLGMNDGDFPRSRPPVDFDLMARDFRPGDRSRREDDRYLFLEALLSARDHLHISWVGKSVEDNADRPPSVLVSQLRDHLQALGRAIGLGPQGLAGLTVEHRLQAFNPEYFGTRPGASPLFTYAREWERERGGEWKGGGEASPQAREAEPIGSNAPLPVPEIRTPISFKQLADFLKNPPKTFFQERLGVRYETNDLTCADQEPFGLDGLERWTLQDELIQVRRQAYVRDPKDALSQSQAVTCQLNRIGRRGEFPLGAQADMVKHALLEPLDRMFEDYQSIQELWPQTEEDLLFDYEKEVAGQRVTVQGRLSSLYSNAKEQGECRYARVELNSSDLLEAKDRSYRRDKLLASWVMHLAAHVQGVALTTFIVGKNGRVTLNPLAEEDARKCFDDLVESYLCGLCAPLPLLPKTGFAWLMNGGLEGADKAVVAARKVYEDGYHFSGEASQSDYGRRVFPTLDDLLADGCFPELCHKLYAPLMSCLGRAEARPPKAKNSDKDQ